MDFVNYIKPELLILIPVLYLVGIAIKRSKIDDKFIPLVLGLSGIVLSTVWVLATSNVSGYQQVLTAVFTAVTQGVLCAGASVYANQIVKQRGKDDNGNGEV